MFGGKSPGHVFDKRFEKPLPGRGGGSFQQHPQGVILFEAAFLVR
jgi:hypothetical protein